MVDLVGGTIVGRTISGMAMTGRTVGEYSPSAWTSSTMIAQVGIDGGITLYIRSCPRVFTRSHFIASPYQGVLPVTRATPLLLGLLYHIIRNERTFRIPCAWRSTLSDTIDGEIYHRESETFTGATPIGTNNQDFKYSSIPVSFHPLNNAKKLKEMTEK